jgi:HAD superfamily hydrolase (TIGR01549 family)
VSADLLPLPTPAAVLFDVDYTLLEPSEQFEAPGYRRMGERFGLDLDTSRWREAEAAAYRAAKQRRQEHGDVHDEGVLHAIARAVIEGLGGGDEAAVAACAAAVIDAWVKVDNFGLYEDVLPCMERLSAAGVRMGLVSNTERSLEEVVTYFALERFIEVTVASAEVGLFKPSPAIFAAATDRLGIAPSQAVMVGDSVEDDVRGAQRFGCRAILLDRAGRYRLDVPTIRSLDELPAALGL